MLYMQVHEGFITSVYNIDNKFLSFPALINNYNCSAAVTVLGIVSNFLSLYLANILYQFNNICIVCVSTYVINAAITFFAIKKFRMLPDTRDKKEK